MKRFLWGCLLAGLLGGGVARAQAPGSRAVVYTVTDDREYRRFQVPQVRLPDAAVARRINAVLLRKFRDRSFGEIDSTRNPRQQVRRAARNCCFEEEKKT